jgi:hypothetical protein
VRITIYREFYHSIIYIAKEGRYVRIMFIYVVWCQSVLYYRGNMEGILIEAKLLSLHWFLISFLVFGRVRRFLFLCFVFLFFFLSFFIVVFFLSSICVSDSPFDFLCCLSEIVVMTKDHMN